MDGLDPLAWFNCRSNDNSLLQCPSVRANGCMRLAFLVQVQLDVSPRSLMPVPSRRSACYFPQLPSVGRLQTQVNIFPNPTQRDHRSFYLSSIQKSPSINRSPPEHQTQWYTPAETAARPGSVSGVAPNAPPNTTARATARRPSGRRTRGSAPSKSPSTQATEPTENRRLRLPLSLLLPSPPPPPPQPFLRSRTSPSPSPSHSPNCKSAPGCTTAPKKTCTSCSSTPSACALTTTSSPASTPAAPSSLASPPANPLSALSWTASRAARGCCRPGGRPRREGLASGWVRRSRRAGIRCASRRRRGTSMSGMGIR